ncbi:MAG: hypothetical protein CVV47_14565 [Spirochaetae bacterium HGW-Spirochaetae-3]|jgi:MFS family permease|nr:MAG: hypothetical protein CVV47_14565 [Spirochaetae bacterium HGW-Spirochaetae-3]
MPHTRNYRLLVLIAFLQGIVFYAPIATIYRRTYGLDIQGLFLIESISWILTVILEAPWGRFADRFGYRRTLLVGNVVFLASKVVFSFASGFSGFLAERLLLSLALSALSGCTEALLYRSVGAAESDKAFGRWHAASGFGLLVASIAAPLLYAGSLRITAYGTIVPYAAALACSYLLVDMGEGQELRRSGSPQPGSGLRYALAALSKDRGLMLFLVASAVMGEAAQSATVFLAPLQYERAGIPIAAFGALFAAIQGVALAAAGSWRIVRAFGRERVFRSLLTIVALSLAALALSDAAALGVVALLAIAVSAAMFRPLSASLQNERVVGSERATALSVNAMVAELVAAALNVGVGRAAGAGLPIGFGVLAAITAAMAFLPRRALGRRPGDV